jgi:TPR repeat protein
MFFNCPKTKSTKGDLTMPAYICVSHALSRREETDVFCRGLSRYGFRFACIHEQSDPQHRAETLNEASLLVALTCPAAVEAETVASDIRFALGRGIPVLCVSMAENSLDERFCATAEGGAALIPAPRVDTPDRQTVALFVHRLFVRHLARLESCFTANRCVVDAYGRAVTAAVAAHKGDPKACYALGQAYERGEGVPKLEVEAAHWISMAAAKGILDARVRMGELYLMGRGAERDPEIAVRVFTEAALAGDPRGNYHMGMCYLRGLGVMKDPQRARESLLMAAEDNYPPALYELGLLYRDGIGGARDTRAAIRSLYMACRIGAEKAGLEMPLSTSALPKGRRVTCVTMRQLRRTRLTNLLTRSLEKKGQALPEGRAGERIASCFSKSRVTRSILPEDVWGHEIEETVERPELLSGAIHFSIPEVAVTLGSVLAAGDRTEGQYPLPSLALAWYRYALRMGSTDAAYRLGDAYRRGHGVPADGQRAFRLFSLGAHRGDEKSRFALGVCYEQGIGTEPDPRKAFQNYETAAHAGYAPAENNLGGCYERGIGVVRDVTAAAEWYSRAAVELPEAACRLGLCYE